MKKIWKLYIIFFIFFVFGDMFSTFAIVQEQTAISEGEERSEYFVPEECVCKLPPQCDRSVIMEKIGSGKVPLVWKMFALKLGVAISVLWMVFANHKITLLALTVISILITGNNISVLFFDIRNYMIFAEVIGVYFCIKYFARFKED